MKHILFFDKGGKQHTCETLEIAQVVIEDLARRGCALTYQLDNESSIHIDFGGAVVVGNPYQRPLPNITFFDQHYSFVRSAVRKAAAKGDRGGYFKIHAERAICLTPNTFEQLASFLETNKERLMLAEAAQAEIFFERMAELKQNSPHII